MNQAHWHLLVNHLPIIFPIVGLLVMFTGVIAKSEAVKRTAYMIFAIGAISAVVAMNTGEGAEEVVEKIGGISDKYIEIHEEKAETFALLSYILGAISLAGLWLSFKQKSFSNIVSVITMVFAVATLYFAKDTGTSGGEIRHTEIRSGNNTPFMENGGGEYDDDD